MGHPLHEAVAKRIQAHLPAGAKLLCDPACGGKQQLPLFIGPQPTRDARMCCVDLLVVSPRGEVQVIVEIEESGFLPTKICGKFFQAVLADHFIHDGQDDPAVPYANKVAFVQVLDNSKYPRAGSSKKEQGRQIAARIDAMLPLGRIAQYRLAFADGRGDVTAINSVAEAVAVATGSAT